jgi:hypothetical protein
MRHGSLIGALLITLCGCPGGNGAIGDHCSSHGDCSSQLQCVANICVPRCERAPDCGDGYSCDEDGLCKPATGQVGDTCRSEVECTAGLSCQIEGSELADDGLLRASCIGENTGRPTGATCEGNGDCRNNLCDLGHCVELCSTDRDCGAGMLCTQIPRLLDVDVEMKERQAAYRGCLQARGSIRWSIPVGSPTEQVLVPVPASARSLTMLFTVDDPTQLVGVTSIKLPDFFAATEDLIADYPDYYSDPYVRHRLLLGQSVLNMPVSPAPPAQLRNGVYKMIVQSKRPNGGCPNPPCPGTATPTVDAVFKVDDAAILDLHFYFLNLDEHPCGEAFGGKLDAKTAQNATYFGSYLTEIKNILGSAVYFEVGNVTYEDLRDHADLDGLDVDNVTSLLALGKHDTGVNVFFVRTLSPIGLQAFGPNPGPAGLGSTKLSGIVIGIDTLCYRNWSDLARLTSHEIARYMGLYDNVGLDASQTDPIVDSDTSPANLMFYSELGNGSFLSAGQKQILRRSAVLR